MVVVDDYDWMDEVFPSQKKSFQSTIDIFQTSSVSLYLVGSTNIRCNTLTSGVLVPCSPLFECLQFPIFERLYIPVNLCCLASLGT